MTGCIPAHFSQDGGKREKPFYEGRKAVAGSFQVTVLKDEDYYISVSGKHAGGVFFNKENRVWKLRSTAYRIPVAVDFIIPIKLTQNDEEFAYR